MSYQCVKGSCSLTASSNSHGRPTSRSEYAPSQNLHIQPADQNYRNSTPSNLKRALERISSADSFQGILPLRLCPLAPLRFFISPYPQKPTSQYLKYLMDPSSQFRKKIENHLISPPFSSDSRVYQIFVEKMF